MKETWWLLVVTFFGLRCFMLSSEQGKVDVSAFSFTGEKTGTLNAPTDQRCIKSYHRCGCGCGWGPVL
jgi:hypothetical protein